MIDIEGLHFAYPDSDFLIDVPKLQIADGERAACIGPSGTGKTTLINLMTGILSAKAKRLALDGVELTQLSEDERRTLRIRRVGMVFQQFELLEYLDALDNILLPYHLSPDLVLTADVRDRARDIAERMGITHVLARRPDALSQGERQRVAISRALVTRPKLIVADEPTGNLDPRNSDRILDLLFEQSADHGATLLVVTHDHGLLPRFDRIIDMADIIAGARS